LSAAEICSEGVGEVAIKLDPGLLSVHGTGVPGALGSNPARTVDPTKTAIQPVSEFSDKITSYWKQARTQSETYST
jgi:hypothetical protein